MNQLLSSIKEKQNSEQQKYQLSDIEKQISISHIEKYISISQQILKQPIKEQILTLNQEIRNTNKLTNNKKQYYKHQYQKQLLRELKALGEVKQIPHVKQNIEVSNPDVLLYVLKEQLLRDQNRELLYSSKEYSFGLNSIIGAHGSDQTCLKIRNKNLDYDKIVNDNKLLQQHLLKFKEDISKLFQIPIDKIEILGVQKGSFEIDFKLQGKNLDYIKKMIKVNPLIKEFLDNYCNGNIEFVKYFDQAQTDVTISSDDFNPIYNMSWEGFHEKEERGPPDHKYDYYFPIGCYGFGLNVTKYENSEDWLKMDGNPNEWRILYHGTLNEYVNSIVRNNLQPGQRNLYASDLCYDEYGSAVQVGNGIYFSDRFEVCLNYTSHIEIDRKHFQAIFMTRVNPRKIRQSDRMVDVNYFVVNNSEDVRPYRLLLYETQ
ncbi:unnamed protein product [Paramecium sonneborni]|uniref:PARP catalytic domain-containing protein n=1 Tax=Paramecium sonneborni TaxID=65129 RepID=A0A8S1L7T8_9CILI|nr:unnamed protein product [Paramecium sonneborni]